MDILKKLPIWLIALALIIASAFIGFGIYDNREVCLWPPTIKPKNILPRSPSQRSPSQQIIYLKNFSEIMEKATEVINNAESELWLAVDVPAYGAIGQPEIYPNYRAALMSAAAKPSLVKKIMWFSNNTEHKYYGKDIFNLNDRECEIMFREGEQLRNALHDSIVDTNIPVLAVHNFWMSKRNDGSVKTVIAWQASNPGSSSTLIGIYTEAPEVEKLLNNVWGLWKNQSDTLFWTYLKSIY